MDQNQLEKKRIWLYILGPVHHCGSQSRNSRGAEAGAMKENLQAYFYFPWLTQLSFLYSSWSLASLMEAVPQLGFLLSHVRQTTKIGHHKFTPCQLDTQTHYCEKSVTLSLLPGLVLI